MSISFSNLTAFVVMIIITIILQHYILL